MTLLDFFKTMDHIHFVFGIPYFPERLTDCVYGEIE